jgi:hypothetical protein
MKIVPGQYIQFVQQNKSENCRPEEESSPDRSVVSVNRHPSNPKEEH